MTDLLRVLSGEIPLEPLLDALIAGHLIIWWDGKIYLTDEGEAYMKGVEA